MRILDPQVFGLWGQGFGAFGRRRRKRQRRRPRPTDRRLRARGGRAPAETGSASASPAATPRPASTAPPGRRPARGTRNARERLRRRLRRLRGRRRCPCASARSTPTTDAPHRAVALLPACRTRRTARTAAATRCRASARSATDLPGTAAPAPLVVKDGAPAAGAAGRPISSPSWAAPTSSIRRDRFAETGGAAALTGAARDHERRCGDGGRAWAGEPRRSGLGLPVSAHGLRRLPPGLRRRGADGAAAASAPARPS